MLKFVCVLQSFFLNKSLVFYAVLCSIFAKVEGVTLFYIKKGGPNDCPIQAQCWETFRPIKSGPERLGPEWLGLNCGHPLKEMNIGINTNIYLSNSEKLKRTTSRLPLPSGIQIGIASSSFMSMEEFRQANWHMLPDGLTCQRCFANFYSLRRYVKSGTQICIHC